MRRKIGPASTGRGRPSAGYFTRCLAEEWLDTSLVAARSGRLPGAVRTGASFAGACDEYLRFLVVDRQRKPSTLRDARATIRNHGAIHRMRRCGDAPSVAARLWASVLRHIL